MTVHSKTDVFNFMALRAPRPISARRLQYSYIHDEKIDDYANPRREPREVFSSHSASAVGKVIYKHVFSSTAGHPLEVNQDIINELVGSLQSRQLDFRGTTEDLLVHDLENIEHLRYGNMFRILPSRLESIESDFGIAELRSAKKLIETHCERFNRRTLLAGLSSIFAQAELVNVVFYPKGMHDPIYLDLRSKLFDALYTLYVLRRVVAVNLDDVICGLQVLHTLEYLAVDSFLNAIYSGQISPEADPIAAVHLELFRKVFPELTDATVRRGSARSYLIRSKADLVELFQAAPIVHPIVAELSRYGKTRFNSIRPYLGDLKVVKQWLVGYKVGEISHIHNVMKGEEKERNVRHLEKTEETLSFSSETSQSTETESSSTERYDLKREAERVIKTDVNVMATANMTYKYGEIFTATAGANFAYASANQDSQKSASNYAREVLNKAVTNVQTRSTQQRSVSKLSETEEKNNHKFSNIQQNATHISGIYRWLDKKYKAQLYNFGQRWMFEFVVPEPSAFYVTSKLKAAEFDTPSLQKPPVPVYATVTLAVPGAPNTPLTPQGITPAVFNALRLEYDLAEFSFPLETYWVPFTDKQRGNNDLSANIGNAGDMVWTSTQFRSAIPKGYDVDSISIVGTVQFVGSAENPAEHWESNQVLFMLNGRNVLDIRDGRLDDANRLPHERNEYWRADGVVPLNPPQPIPDGEVILDLNFQDLKRFSLMVYLSLKRNPAHLIDWQTQVYNKLRTIEAVRVEKANQELQFSYNEQLADYRSELDELRAKVLNDVIQGRSEAFNSQLIAQELKKHCITMIAKEFDFTALMDDVLSGVDAAPLKSVNISYDKYVVEEVTATEDGTAVTRAFAGFKGLSETVDYPKIDIGLAHNKARYIQFLEHAFEWQHLAYVFQPYFWAHESKWIKLMNRLDYTDNNMTAFLKAGSARVVIAVTPGFYSAVMHFLATREPWEGGSLPVIGDPLFVPIYEEIRNKQDDLAKATPEGEPWEFELPTSLVYLQDSSSPIPTDLLAEPPPVNP